VTVQEKPVREQAAVKSVRLARLACACNNNQAAKPAKAAQRKYRDEGMFSRLGRENFANFFST